MYAFLAWIVLSAFGNYIEPRILAFVIVATSSVNACCSFILLMYLLVFCGCLSNDHLVYNNKHQSTCNKDLSEHIFLTCKESNHLKHDVVADDQFMLCTSFMLNYDRVKLKGSFSFMITSILTNNNSIWCVCNFIFVFPPGLFIRLRSGKSSMKRYLMTQSLYTNILTS